MFVACRKSQRAGWQIEQIAGDIGRDHLQIVGAAIHAHVLDVAQHFRGDGAGATEQVQRHAGRGALRYRPQRTGDSGDVVAAVEDLFCLVLAVDVVQVPEQTIAHIQTAFQTGRDVPGIDILLVDARTAFDRAATDEDEVAVGVEGEAERIEGIGAIDRNGVGQPTSTGTRADEDRFRCSLVGRLTCVVQGLQIPGGVVGEFHPHLTEQTGALARRQQQVELREVEAIGTREILEAARGRVGRIVDRTTAEPVGQGQIELVVGVRINKDEAAARRGRAAAGDAGTRHRKARLLAVTRQDLFLVVATRGDEETGAVGAAAVGDIAAGGFAITFVPLAVIEVDQSTFQVAAGDHVDHTGNGVGAIDRRGAVFQHFDTLDDAERNGVQIDRRTDARGRRLVDPADAIDQYQHALGAEVTQIDRGRTRTHAAAIGRIAEIAAGIEFGVERGATAGQLLQHVADALQATGFELFAGNHIHRRRFGHLGLLDA